MKIEITKEIFIALKLALPLEHFAFSSPMPEHGFNDRVEHYKGPQDLFVDARFTDSKCEYWLFVTRPLQDNL